MYMAALLHFYSSAEGMAATVGLDFSSAIILQMSQKRYLLSIGTRIKIFILAQTLFAARSPEANFKNCFFASSENFAPGQCCDFALFTPSHCLGASWRLHKF
jgi:hypothetical protein